MIDAVLFVVCVVTVLNLLPSTGSSAEWVGGTSLLPSGPGHNASPASLVRLRRQSSCRDGFRCTDGQCVGQYSACDGVKDCADGSDETAKLCRNSPKCPLLAFRCAYGACISGDQRCDGQSDCVDGSDERNCSANPPPVFPCSGGRFRCDNGDCVEQYQVCDGTADCADGSDETSKCRDLIPGCPSKTFRCAYGACVDQGARCNEVQECADGSDEKDCGGDNPVTPKPPPEVASGGDCVLPVYPSIKYSDTEHSSLTPGSRVRNSGFVVWQCDGDQESGSSCKRGQWTPPIRKCQTLCPPLKSTTLDLKCWSGGEVSCDRRHFPGTTVKYQCKLHHQPPDDPGPLIDVRCQDNGEWTRGLPVCRHSCGKTNFQSGVTLTPTVVNGAPAQFGDFPWQAGLYLLGDGAWTLSCGGSLITPNSVLTAAHCVTEVCNGCRPPLLDASKIVVALGTVNKNWTHPERSEIRRNVTKVFVHENYWGSYLNYEADVAVLRWREDVTISSYVMPVCIDVPGTYQPQVTSGTLGYVVGWGYPVNCGWREICASTTSVLLYSNTTVIDHSTCVEEIRSVKLSSLATIPQDKFCTSNISVSVIQKGDSGGGIFFRFGGRFYTYGIVSVKFQRNDHTSSELLYSVGAFTNVSHYIDWIKDKNTLRLE